MCSLRQAFGMYGAFREGLGKHLWNIYASICGGFRQVCRRLCSLQARICGGFRQAFRHLWSLWGFMEPLGKINPDTVQLSGIYGIIRQPFMEHLGNQLSKPVYSSYNEQLFERLAPLGIMAAQLLCSKDIPINICCSDDNKI